MKTRFPRCVNHFMLLALLLCVPGVAAHAGPEVQAGPYHVELTTDPPVVPTTGRAKLMLKLTDSAGKPVEGATLRVLTQMHGMNMGERDETAVPVPGQTGVYTAPAQFAMEGRYEATLKIDGAKGSVTTSLPLDTGQNTAPTVTSSTVSSGGGFSPVTLWPWAVGLLILGIVLVQMRRTGQRLSLRGIANRGVIGGTILLGLALWGALYAVQHWRRPGSMTPLEAQSMQMNLPAPLGVAPVELATVESGTMSSSVRYTGQAVGYVEQDLTARVAGIITWMPFYTGDSVKRGQLLARLDTSQSAPQVAMQRGQLVMAQEGVAVAQKDYLQAEAQVAEAHAEVGMKVGAVESARADVTAAEQERVNAQANRDAAESMRADANAQLQATQADAEYWRVEIDREVSLLKAGAVTREEYQREKAEADNADAKVRQAQARILQVQAQIRAAEAEVQKAVAMVVSARARQEQAQSELESHHAHVRSSQAMVASAHQKIVQAQAGVQQAQATLAGASATLGYSEIRAETDGVITQRVLSPGVLVNPGQSLLKVAQVSPIRLQANVAEADLQKARVGASVRINHQNGDETPLLAHISSVSPTVDPTARTGIVEAIVPNRDRRFLPGQYVTLDLLTGQGEHTLHIPTRALRYHTVPSGESLTAQSTPTVWVAEPVAGRESQYTVHEVTVRTGRSDSTNTEILSGLEAGQKVVTVGQDDLHDGDTVSPASAPMAALPTHTMGGGDAMQGMQGMQNASSHEGGTQ